MSEPVPNRGCGACNACCKALAIEALAKAPGILCPHFAAGCTIYQRRPPTCRAWYCGWRLLQPLGEEWRPDLCEILIVPLSTSAPIRLEVGMQFELIGALDRIFWEPFVNLVAVLIGGNVRTYLAVPSQAGCFSARALLNDSAPLKQAIAEADFSRTTAILSEAVQACLRHPKTQFGAETP